ncbi:SulP family inorganic anion transporter [Ferruginibacter sp. HRS2-29]|uniref:SulP family inorganic anion transporter n=1 Tax=Ferruginibacter sp. HRS2-29 TaxID=2487334 RepID=UPI0020CFB60B|nr:SulP family inorganic anion transporter [Ferruginibacter sp. HRS2-29]MCP9752930.1 SulP family inorganic anion transporter [Ferruginibacter sp. HRS2-29]
MKKYFQGVGSDLPASIVVFLVAVPLCLGVAVASGAPPFTGLIAGMTGGIVVGFISKSQLSVSGPAAGLTAIVAAAILKMPVIEAFFLAVVLSGILQIIMGIFKLGVIGDYVPNSVIKGMLAAIGIILILKQIPYLVGYKTSFEGDETFIEASGENTFSSVLNSLNHLTPIAVAIGILGILILIGFETKWMKKQKIFNILSGPLVVVIVGVLINIFLGDLDHKLTNKEAQLVNIPVAGSAAEFLSFFKLPDWSAITNPDVWFTAITLALVASLETLLGIEAVDKLDPLKRATPSNRELVAQGTGNIVSGLLGGLPVTSVIVRSSANVNAGAKTKVSTILHGVLILLCVFFVPNMLNMIPLAALAAILIFTGYKLAKVTLFIDYYKRGWDQFIPFIVTIIAIVRIDLLKGVLIGIATGIFYIIRGNFRTAIFTVKDKDYYLIRLRKDISFFSKPKLKKELEAIPENSKLMIDLTKAEFIDKDIIETINEFTAHAALKNIGVTLNKSMYNESHQLIDTKQFNVDDSAH